MKKIFLTSDLHFFHKNIIKYCNRPFSDVNHMNEVLIRNWNNKIKENEDVYFLGDFAFGLKKYSDEIVEIFDSLKGNKFLIKGNHDYGITLKLNWVSVHSELNLVHKNTEFHLTHYPKLETNITWQTSLRHVILHGHCHGMMNSSELDEKEKIFDIYDVGVDRRNYEPVELEFFDVRKCP